MMPKRRQQTTEGRLRQIEMQAKAMRLDNRGLRRQPRVAITADDASTTYPRSGTVFPIKFVDAYFDQSTGGTVTLEERHNDVQAWVHNVAKVWLSPDLVVEAFQDRGLGDKGDGDLFVDLRPSYWVITGSSGITAKDGDELGSGTATVQTFDANDDVVELLDGQGNSIEITVYNASTSEIAGDTLVRVDPEAKTGRLVVDVTGEAPDDRIRLWGDVSQMVGLRYPKYGIVCPTATGGDYFPSDREGTIRIKGWKNDGNDVGWYIVRPFQGYQIPHNLGIPTEDYYVSTEKMDQSNPFGYGYTAAETPRKVRIPTHLKSTVSRINSGLNTSHLDEPWGPIFSEDSSLGSDVYSIWRGAPGFRIKAGPVEYLDDDGQWRWYVWAIRDHTTPFAVVARENWTRFTSFDGSDDYAGSHYVRCYLMNNRKDGGDRIEDFETNPRVYAGQDIEHPKVEVTVWLPSPTRMMHPNIVAGQVLHCRFSYVIGNEYESNFPASPPSRSVITDYPYLDAAIGTLKPMARRVSGDPSFQMQGWGRANETYNSADDGGSEKDLTFKLIGESSIDQSEVKQDTGIEVAGVEWWERLDNSVNGA